MKRMLLLGTAPLALGYVNGHGRTETVMIDGADGPVRVNKSDFDADQAGDKKMKKAKKQDDTATGGKRSDVNVTGQGQGGEVKTTAAPAAPNFNGPEGAAPEPMDEVKGAAAPKATSADQLLVMKSTKGKTKGKFILVDGTGAPIEGDKAKALGIDPEGYDTEEAAKAKQTHTNPVAPAN